MIQNAQTFVEVSSFYLSNMLISVFSGCICAKLTNRTFLSVEVTWGDASNQCSDWCPKGKS